MLLRGLLTAFSIFTLKDCSSNNQLAKITSLSMDPPNPGPGQSVSVSVYYDLYTNVTAGTAYYDATLNGIPYNTLDPLCTQTQCPKYPGTYVEYSNTTIPQMTGKFGLKIRWADETNTEIWCMQIDGRLPTDEL
jgi:hypothetical protein